MDTVVVRRCELTLHGQGGWGWGLDPRRYVDQALPAIDLALQQVIDEAGLPDGADVHLTTPVLLRWRPDHTLDDTTRQAFVAALRDAVATTSRDAIDAPGPEDAPAAAQPPATAPRSATEPAAVAGLARLLASWSRTGLLSSMLARWPEAAVLRWVAALAAESPGHESIDLEAEAVDAVAATVLAQVATARPALPAAHRLLVVLAALVAAAGGRPVGLRTIRRAAHLAGATAIVDDLPARDTPTERAAPEVEPAPPVPQLAGPRSTAAASARREARTVRAPGLPFLVLVQLARLGYLDAVWAVASTTAAPGDTCAGLVGGLAGKALPAPGHGWRREPDEIAAVHAVSGRYGADWDRTVHDLARAADLVEAPLRTALTQLYADPAPAEVEITETPYGTVLGERAGALPIAWLADRGELEDTLHQLGDPASRTSSRFGHFAERLQGRPAYPGVDLPSLERHLGAAVGTALGSLALELWGATTDAPSRALDRFADLEVEVRTGGDERAPDLTVAVPRGRRWLDLGRAGLLDRWPVPWSSTGWELVSW